MTRRFYAPPSNRRWANAEDINIPHCVGNGDEAIAMFLRHHAQWVHDTPVGVSI